MGEPALTRLEERRLELILADAIKAHMPAWWATVHENGNSNLVDIRCAITAMRRVAAEEREICAIIADEFARPGNRAPADLGADNGLWNNCADRIATCIRANSSSSHEVAALPKPIEKMG